MQAPHRLQNCVMHWAIDVKLRDVCRAVSRNFCILRQRETDTVTDISIV